MKNKYMKTKIKKTIYTLIAMIGFANVSLAQCGTIMVNSGKLQYPDTITNLPIAFQDNSYSTTIQLYCPASYSGIPLTSIRSFSITGLPDSFSFSMYPTSGAIAANNSGCIKIVSSKVIAPIGSFPITINYVATAGSYTSPSSILGYVIQLKEPVSLSTSVVNVNCLAKTSGSINLNAKGGLPPYQYAINNGPFQSSNEFVNLQIGAYILKVKDSLNVIVQQIDTIKALQPISTVTMVGSTSVATGATVNYLVSQQTGYSYTWEITNGIIASGQGANSAQVIWAQFKGQGNIKVKATSPTTGCIDTAMLNVTIGSTNISIIGQSLLCTIYPNPAKDELIISNTQKLNGSHIIIYDMIGRKMLEENITSVTNEHTVLVSELKSGAYILSIQKEGETSRIKFVKE
jgi:hypothetical protein